ncbi:M48 family metallopeptidase [Motilimonas sp. 1_MG-2023]|uniref:M48 family metallopeptidase n=1 Tax=Motilimonas sp. 1_MG-2023 TaxID=3062672 RepID=UPI0026E2C439|nr:M48 family metallopeptidase [Motilimonas sp. 1_MG-2023]MDO6526309.1 M48 family metallopeptidase [Motilimonas sp. 1_MG-2023]
MEISGVYYSGKSSAALSSALILHAENRISVNQTDIYLSLDELDIAPRIGNGNRWVYFPDGSSFESQDNDALDLLSKRQRKHGFSLHQLESKLRYIIPSLIFTLIFCVGFFIWGVPASTQLIAQALPDSTSKLLGNQSLEIVNRTLFDPSELSDEKQQNLHALFKPYLSQGQRVLIRSSEALGANAIALPNGILVFTDELINITTEQELLAVLGHELGHVEHKHGLQALIRSSLLLFVYTLITGDAAGASSSIAALPTLLLEQGYSRDFEREADDYAMAFLKQHNIPRTALMGALNKIYQAHEIDKQASLSDYLSSHPAPKERLERLQAVD